MNPKPIFLLDLLLGALAVLVVAGAIAPGLHAISYAIGGVS